MIKDLGGLVQTGIVTPSSTDWRIRLIFTDGTDRVVRISPGRLSEAEAVARAKRHAKIFDETVLEKIEADRVEKSTQIASFGIVQK